MSISRNVININRIFKAAISTEHFEKFKQTFLSEEKNLLAQNVCSKVDPFEVALSRKRIEETQHIFNTKVSLFFFVNILFNFVFLD